MLPSQDILIITPEYPPGITAGVGTHVQQLATGLKPHFRNIDVLAYSSTPRPPYLEDRIHVEFITPALGSTNDIPVALKDLSRAAVLQARSLIGSRGSAPAVIHTHDWYGTDIALELSQQYEAPVVGTIHLLHDPCLRWWGQTIPPYITEAEAKLCQKADALIGVSRSLRDEICKVHQKNSDSVHAIYNGYIPPSSSLTPDRRTYARQKIGVPLQDALIVYVGRFAPQKGVLALLESVRAVLASAPNASYLLVGRLDDEYSASIDQYLRDNPDVACHVRILGWQPLDGLADIYAAADVAIVPSIYEPLGYTALDAISYLVPLIASDVGGLREMVNHMESGQLIPVEQVSGNLRQPSVDALASAQIWALEHKDKAKQMALRAKETISGRMSNERMIRDTLAVYNSVIRQKDTLVS